MLCAGLMPAVTVGSKHPEIPCLADSIISSFVFTIWRKPHWTAKHSALRSRRPAASAVRAKGHSMAEIHPYYEGHRAAMQAAMRQRLDLAEAMLRERAHLSDLDKVREEVMAEFEIVLT